LLSARTSGASADLPPSNSQERLVEWTIESHKAYTDPFNDVDVDVVFTKDDQSWRVPTFWRGENRWTVRFAPPVSGTYAYHLESTDRSNPDINGHEGHITVAAYAGDNTLLKHGMIRVSANKRYFEYADGKPFYWLGDTWWTGLSDRLSWDGFKILAADRKKKGYTVALIQGGFAPMQEEHAPIDPGFSNEGGAVYPPDFRALNPKYFDYADRRIQHMIDMGIVPAIVGGTRGLITQMGEAKLKQYWRYLVARYGAYPVFWIVADEPLDPPPARVAQLKYLKSMVEPGWTEVARYIRSIDPYHHPLSTNEINAPYDTPFEDASVTDFDLIQPGHVGWPSIATAVSQITSRYPQHNKPIVQGEIGYETHGQDHFENFQRAAFWLAMLNGAAGHTYGTIETSEMYTSDKPLHRIRYSVYTWEEAMSFPGSTQVGLDSKFLRQFAWQDLVPHPEWVTPHGTTLFDLHGGASGTDEVDAIIDARLHDEYPLEDRVPRGEWSKRQGTFRRPYAAGIPGKLRLIYLPYFGTGNSGSPTVLGLEPGVKYAVYYWEPSLGVRFDLGEVARSEPGKLLFKDSLDHGPRTRWTTSAVEGGSAALVKAVRGPDSVVAVDAKSDSQAAVLLRFQDAANYLRAVYSPQKQGIFLIWRVDGHDEPLAGFTPTPDLGPTIRLTAEVRGSQSIVSITDQTHTYTSQIVDADEGLAAIAGGGLAKIKAGEGPASEGGYVGLQQENGATTQKYANFEVRQSEGPFSQPSKQIDIVDANGVFRGKMNSPGWDDYGRKDKIALLDAYRPERMPYPRDWVLVLERR